MPVVSQAVGTPLQAANPSGGKEPKRVVRQLEASTLDVKHDFVYLAHPLRWDVMMTDRGPEVLPALTQLEFQPGLAGVLPVKGEMSGDPSYAITTKQSKGWLVIPEDFEVTAFGERRRGYRHVYDGRGGPDSHHCSVWERPYQVGGTAMIQRDEAGYIQFLRDVAAKVMPPIDPNVRRGLEARLRDMHRTAASASKNSYTADNVRAQLEQKLQAFTAPEVQPEIRAGKSPKPAPRATSGGDDA